MIFLSKSFIIDLYYFYYLDEFLVKKGKTS